MNSDGSQQTRLTDNSYSDDSPQWSSDGKKIVFISDRVKSQSFFFSEIYIMDADGSNQVRITNKGSYRWTPSAPQWSPDGKKILFYVSEFDQKLDKSISEIYTINIDGAELTRLTFHSLDAIDPKWSPDGNMIVYSLHDYGVGNIYVVNTDGTSDTRLTFNHRYNIDPEWSPDGKKIIYMSEYTNTVYDLYAINIDGTDEKQITRDADANWLPKWSPDGSKIAYFYNDGISDNICLVDVDSRESKCFVNAGDDAYPEWSPDSRKILFKSSNEGRRDIYTMDVDGNNIFRLTEENNNGFGFGEYQWQP